MKVTLQKVKILDDGNWFGKGSFRFDLQYQVADGHINKQDITCTYKRNTGDIINFNWVIFNQIVPAGSHYIITIFADNWCLLPWPSYYSYDCMNWHATESIVYDPSDFYEIMPSGFQSLPPLTDLTHITYTVIKTGMGNFIKFYYTVELTVV